MELYLLIQIYKAKKTTRVVFSDTVFVCLYIPGLSSLEEVATGVEHILADMIAKDPETLTYVKTL